jgi:hypothetical protein
MPNRTPKTVYILGAGFSMSAGAPRQSRIMSLIFDLPDYLPGVRDKKQRFLKFLEDAFSIRSPHHREVYLEDIYTPMDRCISDDLSLRGVDLSRLSDVRNDMEYLIAWAIEYNVQEDRSRDDYYIPAFARHLVSIASDRTKKEDERSADRAKNHDPFSIISLNWDILLDKALDLALRDQDALLDSNDDYSKIGVVDYCCYISSVEAGDKRVRSGLWTLGAGGYNVKLLKIHGSMNWLQCPTCQRLFTDFSGKHVVTNALDPVNCRHCTKHDVPVKLRSSLVMPTFLKDLSNFQIKLVWQNAGVEIMEADKLVFIGYSLPQADFEFRNLLSRMKHINVKIDVVLNDGEANPAAVQYKQFFAGHEIAFPAPGVVEYVRQLIGDSTA